jgi:hypothetical protein
MENAPEKSFGFQYEHDGKSCMFNVIAATRQEPVQCTNHHVSP